MLLSLCLLFVVSVNPGLFAQDQAWGSIMQFKAPIAFWAGNAKLPAGTYKITQPSTGDGTILKIQGTGGHEAFLDTNPISAVGTHKAGDVVFGKVGNDEYLEEFYLPAGASSFGSAVGFKVVPSKAKPAGASAQHSVPGTK